MRSTELMFLLAAAFVVDNKCYFCYNVCMKKCYILMGVPGSGKSTWIKDGVYDRSNVVVASTDNFIEAEAARQCLTYSEVFTDNMKKAVAYMAKTVVDAVRNEYDIIWDQTSTTVASRLKKFRMLPASYEVIGIVFKTPDKEELERRLLSRPGKTIPGHVIRSMIAGWEEPTEAEGFSKIIYME